MFLFYFSIALAVASSALYHFVAKSTPSNVNFTVSLLVTYAVAFGVTLFLGFVLRVVRPRELWARGLALALGYTLWTGLLGAAATPGGLGQDRVGSWFWWAEYGVIWSYPLWGTAEAFRYWLKLGFVSFGGDGSNETISTVGFGVGGRHRLAHGKGRVRVEGRYDRADSSGFSEPINIFGARVGFGMDLN